MDDIKPRLVSNQMIQQITPNKLFDMLVESYDMGVYEGNRQAKEKKNDIVNIVSQRYLIDNIEIAQMGHD